MDPPEARESTLSIWASAELRISKYGLKPSQGQTTNSTALIRIHKFQSFNSVKNGVQHLHEENYSASISITDDLICASY